MSRTDAMVLGAGIVGTSVALHLAKRGLSVALVDRRNPGEETSYGNAGVLGGAGVYPAAFPRSLWRLLRVALKRTTDAHYHLGALPGVASWLLAFRAASSPARLEETARLMRPLMARSVAEHEALLLEAGAPHLLEKKGWLSLYRTEAAFEALKAELALGEELGMPAVPLDTAGARALEPALAPVFERAIHWPDIASITDPLGVTQAYARRFEALGGVIIRADAKSLHRSGGGWRVDAPEGPVDARETVLALGPWAPDIMDRFGIRLPLGVKRGYHRHFKLAGDPPLGRPVIDADVGFVLAPMRQGIRLTTGAEFAHRDAPPTPVQLERVLPAARQLAPLGAPIEATPWMGRRPCFPDSRPVVGRAPGQPGLWLAYGHGHMGLTLGPATGRLLADLITGATPFVDPAPYRAERFG